MQDERGRIKTEKPHLNERCGEIERGKFASLKSE